MATRTIVRWQFNRDFRIKRTLPSRREAREYVAYVKRLWGIDARMESK